MERIQRGEDFRRLDSDYRTAPTSDGLHNFMRFRRANECPRGRVDAHHKFAVTIGDSVSVAKAQHLWTVVIGP
uniref:Retrotransposon, putative, centromere-specific n=1 Tax=Oryza sativa subsp. japonica TaxID=39947 RepID=Q2QTF5_ORYSJ|nr:retrotransposon, putative, centromere-specific [Oryza sativa Japonica Group]